MNLSAPRAFLLSLILTISSSPGIASDDHPTFGMLFNTKEMSSLSHSCKPTRNGRIECNFVQLSVRKKVNPETIEDLVAEGMAEAGNSTTPTEQDCAEVGRMRAILDGEEKPDNERFYAPNPLEKEDLENIVKAYENWCSDKSKTAYESIMRTALEKESRTCLFSSHTFTQIFKVSEDGKAWISDSSPEGSCGVIQLSRFQKEPEPKAFPFWIFVARKAITNPNGTHDLGMACSDFDESEHLYDWRQRELAPNCDYIEFSAL